jgi:hypothetical protein
MSPKKSLSPPKSQTPCVQVNTQKLRKAIKYALIKADYNPEKVPIKEIVEQ